MMVSVAPPRRVGRYVVFDSFARGGMATVHLGRLVADRGFSRLVAIKMLGGGQASSVYARALEEEARIASRIRHPNVVQPLDFVVDGDELFVIMEYVHGVSFSQLLLAASRSSNGEASLAWPVTCAIMSDVLNGLHAAHEATSEIGRPLGVVHRDVSPQNVLVGVDGIARLADFGIAKVMRRRDEHTETGTVKGKLAYMPPEQLRGLPITRQADIFSAGAVLAEALSGLGPQPSDMTPNVWLAEAIRLIKNNPPLLDVVRTATKDNPRDRFATAAEMGAALADAIAPARADAVADRVTALAGDDLEIREELVRRVEAVPLDSEAPPPPTPAVNTGPPAPMRPLMEELDALDLHTATTGGGTGASLQQQRVPDIETIELVAKMEPISTIEPLELITRTDHISASPPPQQPQPQPRTPKKSRGGAIFFLIGALIAVSTGVIYMRYISPPAVNDTTVNARTNAAAPAWPIEAPPVTMTTTTTTQTSTAPPPPKPTATATFTKPAGPKGPKTSKTAAPAIDCDPPFRIDGDGNKHYKPGCLEPR